MPRVQWIERTVPGRRDELAAYLQEKHDRSVPFSSVIRDPFGQQGRAHSRLGDPHRDGVDPALMGPRAEELGWSRYRTDAAFHNTYWISSWPRSDIGPSFLAPLLMQSATVRTVAVTIEPIPFGQAMRRAEMAQTLELAGEMERRRQGFMTTASERRRAQAVTRREEELADGFAEMRFAGFVTVSA